MSCTTSLLACAFVARAALPNACARKTEVPRATFGCIVKNHTCCDKCVKYFVPQGYVCQSNLGQSRFGVSNARLVATDSSCHHPCETKPRSKKTRHKHCPVPACVVHAGGMGSDHGICVMVHTVRRIALSMYSEQSIVGSLLLGRHPLTEHSSLCCIS